MDGESELLQTGRSGGVGFRAVAWKLSLAQLCPFSRTTSALVQAQSTRSYSERGRTRLLIAGMFFFSFSWKTHRSQDPTLWEMLPRKTCLVHQPKSLVRSSDINWSLFVWIASKWHEANTSLYLKDCVFCCTFESSVWLFKQLLHAFPCLGLAKQCCSCLIFVRIGSIQCQHTAHGFKPSAFSIFLHFEDDISEAHPRSREVAKAPVTSNRGWKDQKQQDIMSNLSLWFFWVSVERSCRAAPLLNEGHVDGRTCTLGSEGCFKGASLSTNFLKSLRRRAAQMVCYDYDTQWHFCMHQSVFFLLWPELFIHPPNGKHTPKMDSSCSGRLFTWLQRTPIRQVNNVISNGHCERRTRGPL